MQRLLLLVLLLVWSGCDAMSPASVGDLTLDVSGDSFATDVEIEAAAQNETDRTLLLYDCGGHVLLQVQKETASGWETVAFVNSDCGATTFIVPFRLDAGRRQPVAFRVESPGTYRLQTYFGTVAGPGTDVGRADWVEAVSERFVVTAP